MGPDDELPRNEMKDSFTAKRRQTEQQKSSNFPDGNDGTTKLLSSKSSSSSSSSSFGTLTANFSDWVNDHLLVARCGAMATIALLTAYGLAASPLFFRYTSIADIPRRVDRQRRLQLAGRLYYCQHPRNNNNNAQLLLLRHLAPWERWLPLAWANAVRKWHPQQASTSQSNEHLLPLHVIGIELVQPPQRHQSFADSSHLLFEQQQRMNTTANSIAQVHYPEQLVEESVVVCQVYARGKRRQRVDPTFAATRATEPSTTAVTDTSKNAVWGSRVQQQYPQHSNNNNDEDTILCGRLTFHHRWGADVGESWVRQGRAIVSSVENNSSLYYPPGYGPEIDDDTLHVDDSRTLAHYISQRLVPAEYEACRNHRGVWADPDYRTSRADVVEEVEFQTHARWYERLWRWVRDRPLGWQGSKKKKK